MRLEINYSKQSLKFLKKNPATLSQKKVVELLSKSARAIILHEVLNIDLKLLQGRLYGFYRVRYRNIRIIFQITSAGELIVIDIETIDYRGNIY